MPHYSEEIKKAVVDQIVNGDLSLEEAMLKYNVRAKLTIINWLRTAQLSELYKITAPLKSNNND